MVAGQDLVSIGAGCDSVPNNPIDPKKSFQPQKHSTFLERLFIILQVMAVTA